MNVEPPHSGCPKCGHPTGFVDVRPQYHEPAGNPYYDGMHGAWEHLDWECKGCGYRVETATADFVPAAEALR